jgi:hypothetical protein
MSESASPDKARAPDAVADKESTANFENHRIRRFFSKVKNHFGWLNKPWVAGTLTGVISGTLVAFFLSGTGQAALATIRGGFANPSCANPQGLLQVPNDQIFANAYYVQADSIPGYNEYHSPDSTIDGNLGSSWLQFWPSYTTKYGKESSDYIEWSFSQPHNVRLICIVDGWAENNITYRRTLPIGTATIYVTNSEIPPPVGSPQPSGICSSRTAHFRDYLERGGEMGFTDQWQPITFHCVTDNIVLHVDHVPRAWILKRPKLALEQLSGLESPLTGLSEVRFYYCPAFLCVLH